MNHPGHPAESLRSGHRLGRRKLVRQGDIVAALRQRIVAGPFAPGAQLPRHADLERQFHTTLLRACVDNIDQQRQGRPPAPITTIPARFEDEAVPVPVTTEDLLVKVK